MRHYYPKAQAYFASKDEQKNCCIKLLDIVMHVQTHFPPSDHFFSAKPDYGRYRICMLHAYCVHIYFLKLIIEQHLNDVE